MTVSPYYCVFRATYPSSTSDGEISSNGDVKLSATTPKLFLSSMNEAQVEVMVEHTRRLLNSDFTKTHLGYNSFTIIHHPSFFSDSSVSAETKYLCFNYIIRKQTDNTTHPSESAYPANDWQFIVCLLHPAVENFDLFLSDIEHYCEELEPLLISYNTSASDSPRKIDSLALQLDEWMFLSIQYVIRCVLSWEPYLPEILRAILIGQPFQFAGTRNAQIEADLIRFKAIASVLPIIRSSADTTISTESPSPLVLCCQTNTVQIAHSNVYCKLWAASLVDYATRNDYVGVRSCIEERKFEVVGELNKFRRSLSSSKQSNYVLYQTYLKLKQHNNGDVLLELLQHVHTSSTDRLWFEVLTALINFNKSLN